MIIKYNWDKKQFTSITRAIVENKHKFFPRCVICLFVACRLSCPVPCELSRDGFLEGLEIVDGRYRRNYLFSSLVA